MPRGTRWARREVPHLLTHEWPERLGAVLVLAVRDVLEERADEQGVRSERDPEPDQPILHEEPRTLAVERRCAESPRNQEEQPEPEKPADAEQRGDRVDHASGHLVVRLEVPGPIESVRDRAVHRDHADNQQDLQRVEVGQASAHRGPYTLRHRKVPLRTRRGQGSMRFSGL